VTGIRVCLNVARGRTRAHTHSDIVIVIITNNINNAKITTTTIKIATEQQPMSATYVEIHKRHPCVCALHYT